MEVIASWDFELHASSDEEKTLTPISFGPKNKVSWGYNIPFDVEQFKWSKLLLLDDKGLPEDTPIEVVNLVLRNIWNHCKQRIVETVSMNLVNYSKFHFVITIPTICPEYAPELEAAAMATLNDMEGRYDIKACLVAVDCGGGTVDLISYEMVDIAPMVVKECVKVQGGLCGAVFVDEAFLGFLKEKFGKEAWIKMETETRQRLVHDQWNIRLSLRLTACMRVGAFDPTVNKICDLGAEQVAAVSEDKNKDPKSGKISTTEPVRVSARALFAAEGASERMHSLTIYTTTKKPPPKRSDSRIQELRAVDWDDSIAVTSMPTLINPLGKVFYELSFEVEITYAGGSLDSTTGKRQGSKNVVVDFKDKDLIVTASWPWPMLVSPFGDPSRRLEL
ncbi:hypothetical protein VTI74DRAFT_3620 [Chaetomium olivicolor]